MRTERQCTYCGVVFLPRYGKPGTFCSVNCLAVGRRKTGRVHHRGGYFQLAFTDLDVSKHRNVKYKNRQVLILEHAYKAELALGHALPPGACVHHVDGNPSNNANANLVICENSGYHNTLHHRQRVADRGGDPDSEWFCNRCQSLRPISEFYRYQKALCRACNRQSRRAGKRSREVSREATE